MTALRHTREEKAERRTAIFYVFLTLFAVFLFILVGIPLLARVTGFFSDLKGGGTAIVTDDKTPPAPPRLDSLPEATSERSLEVTGETEPGATAILLVNGEENEFIVGSEGRFSQTVDLRKGENTFSAYAIDKAGNEGQKTDKITVVFDDSSPEIAIASPEDGKEFFGSSEKQVTIKGALSEKASLTINDRLIAVEEDGAFTYTTTLTEGENVFLLKAEDAAGNASELTLTLHYSS